MKSKRLLVYLLITNIGLIASPLTENWGRRMGFVLILFFSAALIFGLLSIREIIFIAAHKRGREPKLQLFSNIILSLSAVMICVFLIELVLLLYPANAGPSSNAPTIPDEWKKRTVEIENTRAAYYWHGVLHVHDKQWMRRTQPFPPKSENVFRIMVVGDSLTYGYGVEESQTYCRRLEELLSKDRDVEVLNLGVCGAQSSDILKIVKKFTPVLKPDLIIYGISLNDFLPSGTGQYANNRRWPFPLPESFKYRMSRQTHIGELLERVYDRLLMKTGIRSDFYDDILENFRDYQARFADDLRRMNAFVTERGYPPVLSIVFHQNPEYGGRSHQIARIAEKAAREAGMNVVPTDDYFKTYNGRSFQVSKWEGHPNAEAHDILARMLLTFIKKIQGGLFYPRRGA